MVIGHTIVGNGSEGVIVMHGWFGGEAFEPMLPFLDTDTFTYAFMDYRGYGKSKSAKGEYTMSEIAGDVAGLAEHLNWSKFHLVGHSMGGMALCRVATDAGERIKSAVAINPVPASGVPFDDESWQLFSGAPDNDGNRRGILDFTTGNRLSGKWLDMMVKNSVDNSDKEAFRAYLTAWAKTDFAEASKVIKTPMKVLVGEHDPALGAEAMKDTYMAWYENAELETLKNSGHYPMQETPVYLATAIDNFMKKHV
jgi:pimeloyl-ACP methyl ester carboxylesterase